MTTHNSQTTWGRSRFGGSQSALLATSILGGALLSQLLAWGVVALVANDFKWWLVPVASLPFVPILAATLWVILVDRSTIKGAARNPEVSVENHWYSKAAETTFHLMIAVMGLGAAAFALFNWEISPSLLLAMTTFLAMLTFQVTYQVYKRKGI